MISYRSNSQLMSKLKKFCLKRQKYRKQALRVMKIHLPTKKLIKMSKIIYQYDAVKPCIIITTINL